MIKFNRILIAFIFFKKKNLRLPSNTFSLSEDQRAIVVYFSSFVDIEAKTFFLMVTLTKDTIAGDNAWLHTSS